MPCKESGREKFKIDLGNNTKLIKWASVSIRENHLAQGNTMPWEVRRNETCLRERSFPCAFMLAPLKKNQGLLKTISLAKISSLFNMCTMLARQLPQSLKMSFCTQDNMIQLALVLWIWEPVSVSRELLTKVKYGLWHKMCAGPKEGLYL